MKTYYKILLMFILTALVLGIFGPMAISSTSNEAFILGVILVFVIYPYLMYLLIKSIDWKTFTDKE